jgi:predicted HTH domain antitoxin
MSTVKVDLPKELLQAAKVPPRQAGAEVKKMLVLYLYARGTISLAKATGLLGVSQWEFFELNEKWGLPVHYGVEEFREDLATLRNLPK